MRCWARAPSDLDLLDAAAHGQRRRAPSRRTQERQRGRQHDDVGADRDLHGQDFRAVPTNADAVSAGKLARGVHKVFATGRGAADSTEHDRVSHGVPPRAGPAARMRRPPRSTPSPGRGVVGRRDLDDVEAAELDPRQRAQEGQRLARLQAGDLRRAGARREAGSSTSMSNDMYTGPAPILARTRSPYCPGGHRDAARSPVMTSNPISRGTSTSAAAYSGPRIPASSRARGIKQPLLDARRNGVPWKYRSP